MVNLCPAGCGAPTDDEFGGPCSDCMVLVGEGHDPECVCPDCLDLPVPPSYRPPGDDGQPSGAGMPGS